VSVQTGNETVIQNEQIYWGLDFPNKDLVFIVGLLIKDVQEQRKVKCALLEESYHPLNAYEECLARLYAHTNGHQIPVQVVKGKDEIG